MGTIDVCHRPVKKALLHATLAGAAFLFVPALLHDLRQVR